MLFRQVATPNYELRSFLRACRRHAFDPVILTYRRDRLSRRDWGIFWASTLASNLMWMASLISVIEVVRLFAG